MSVRTTLFASGEYYHIYNRGNSKQKIFFDKKDYIHFIELLYLCNQEGRFRRDMISKKKNWHESQKDEPLVAIGTYCLMSNHFHILLTPIAEDGVSKFMQKLQTAYVMYLNKKMSRTGGLFEGKFKSSHVGNDRYLKYLFAYIHLNPIKLIQADWKERGIKNKNQALAYLKTYTASSFLDYAGIVRPENIIIDRAYFPDYFPSRNRFFEESMHWITIKTDES